MATLRPQLPGMQVSERAMTPADERMFRAPSAPGVTVSERPMTGAEQRTFRVPGAPADPMQRVGQFARETYQTAVGRNFAGPQQRPSVLRRVGGVAGGALVAAGSLLEDAPKVIGRFKDPNATGIDKVAAGSAAFGKAAGTAAGGLAGAKLGAAAGSAFGPVGTLVGGAIGGGAGAFLANRGADALVAPALRGAQSAPEPAVQGNPRDPAMGMTGAGTDAKARVGDFDRTPSQNLAPALAGVPAQMPQGMARGMIYKTTDANGRPVYSGMDVSGDAQMVDGQGQQLRGGGTVSTVPGMSRAEIDAIMSRPTPGAAPGGAAAGGGGLVAQGGLFDTPRARRQAEALRLEGRGQDLNFSATTRGQDMSFAGVMAGVNEKREARQQELAAAQALRGATASFVQQAGGNPTAAAQMALRAGRTDVAEDLSKQGSANDDAIKRQQQALRDQVRSLSVDDEGKISDALVEQNAAMLQGLSGQLGFSSVEQLMADPSLSRAALKVMKGLNNRNQGLTDVVGLTTPTLRTRLPELTVKGKAPQFETTGFLDGLGPGRKMGDTRIITGGGDLYLPEEVAADEDVKLLLQRMSTPKAK